MAIIFGSDKSGNSNNWTSNNLNNSASTTTTVSFTTVGGFNWTAPAGVTSVSYLVVAGGGGGGSGNISSGRTRSGGGGGAGGTLYGSLSVTPGTSYAIAIGAAGTGSTSESVWGTNGGNSTFASIVSYGGGGGGSSSNEAGQAGGSGGGAATTDIGGAASPAGQGNAGASGGPNSGSFYGGGGGGASSAGSTTTGGSGYVTAISGSSTTYGIGGNGGSSGGAGSSPSNYGSGGGGGAYNTGTRTGANGVQGIIILSYSAATITYDSMVDVPGIANPPSQQDLGGVVPGNYCTLNPLANGTNLVTDSGLLSVSNSTTESNHRTARATMGVSSGKWYWEVHVNNSASVDLVGIISDNSVPNNYVGAVAGSAAWGYQTATGNYYGGGDWVFNASTPPGYTASGVIGIALDLDDGKIWWCNNGTWLPSNSGVGNPSTGTNPIATWSGAKGTTFYPAVSIYNNTGTWVFNFGQCPFKFAPPAGFKSLNTTNLPNPIIKRPSNHFDVKTWTGNGSNLTVGTTAKEVSTFPTSGLRFRKEETNYLTRTPATAGNRKTWTYSVWVKRGSLTTYQRLLSASSIAEEHLIFRESTADIFHYYSGTGGINLQTTRAFKDTTAWTHIVVAVDTTHSNSTERVKLYFDGVRVTSFSTATYPALNADTDINRAIPHGIGGPDSSQYFDGVMSEVNLIDGQALTPSSFGAFDANNNWMPQRYTGTYGTNGFYLPLSKPTNTDTMNYAGSFTGSTSVYLNTPSTTNFAPTGDFTISCWFYLSSHPGSYTVPGGTWTTGTSDEWLIQIQNNGAIRFLTTANTAFSSSGMVDLNRWYYFSATRSGSTITASLNGKPFSTTTLSGTFGNASKTVYIGMQQGANWPLNGYISNFRLVDGTAITTVPTDTSTAVTGTKLLTCNSATIVDNSTNAYAITNNGSVAVVDASPWQRTVGYDASGSNNNFYPINYDYSVPRSTVLTYGTPGTYTWVAPAGVTSVKALVIAGGGAGGTNGGGGGAGGMIYNAAVSVTPGSSYTVTVGRGGASRNEGNATNSVFSSLTAIAGGNGATYAVVGAQNGGSGGGGTLGNNTAGTGTAGQGNAGGAGNNGNSGNTYYHGGGGGAGTAGTAGGSGGAGGAGLLNSITGVPLYYAGGGGGHYFSTNTPVYAAGGIGGGGTGQNSKSGPTAGGKQNTGGGGGGTSAGLGGGPGGTGVVILSYTNAASYIGVGANSLISSGSTVKDSPTDSEDDTGVSGTYPTFNPNFNIGGATISNAGLTLTSDDGSHKIVPATLPISSGKWYFEMTCENAASDAYSAMGLIPYPTPNNDYYTNLPSSTSTTDGFSWQSGIANNLTLWIDYDSTYRYVTMNPITASAIGDVMQIAIDIDNSKIWAGRNNVWYDASGGSTGNPSTGANPTATNVNRYISTYGALVPFCSVGTNNMITANFGQQGFIYTPPTGFKAINTKNLKDAGSTNLPDTYGNFVNTPDLVWIKNRSANSGGGLWNTLLGSSSFLQTTNTNGPATTGTSFDTFLPNGFRLGVDGNITNNSGNAYVSWNWNKGKIPGFDIVSFGSTGGVMQVPHNLGQVPKFIIVKGVNVSSWETYHSSVGPASNIRLDSDAGLNTGADWFNNTSPTSTHFTIAANNPAGYTWIAYLWAEVPGFSKMGSYAGNAGAPYPFINCGFRPAFVLIKGTSSSRNWIVFDNKRTTFNSDAATARFILNTATNESGNERIDFLSNGFKLNTYTYDANAAETYIYVAFAEAPFKYANAR
jgi:hypothetical protein